MHTHTTLLTILAAIATVAGTTIIKSPTPTTTCTKNQHPTTSCTETICADYINSCGQWYGGCYPACSGYTTPSFTDPGCPPTITSSSTLSSHTADPSTSCDLTVCADYTNSCGMMYGTCYPACSGYPTPTPTPPECLTTSSSSSSKTRRPCTKTKCEDYINSCGQTYGGCYPACKGYPTPTFPDPGCPTSAAPYNPGETTSSCAFVCSDFFDDCGNTFGPGCYTSCPGVPMPTYTTPVCNTDPGTYTTA